MSRRSLRLTAASVFLIGFVLFAVGTVLAFAASWSTGRDVLATGGLLMGVARLAAWRFKLPAP